MGKPTALPYVVELSIATSLKTMEKWGFGLSKKEILGLIGRYVKENHIATPFKDGIPGDDYFTRFMRDFHLSQKKPQHVEVARRRSVDPFIVSDYFKILEKELENIPPSRVYNIDETSLCLDPSRVKVVGEKGVAAHRTTSGPGKENITVLLGGNAVGEKLPPLIVYKGKNVWDSWLAKEEEYPGMTYTATKNGWMEAETFKKYFLNTFLKSVDPKRPVILIYDGHSSHIGISLVEAARKNNVVIIKLPPHSSHLLQPMDLSVFKPLKLMWDEEIIKWQRKNYGYKLPKTTFAKILSKVWENLNPTIISNGFQKAGIYPLNAQVIPKEKFEPEAYKRWCQLQQNQPLPQSAPSPEQEPSTSNLEGNKNTSPSQEEEQIAISLSAAHPSNDNHKSFESLLLEQIKQTPRTTMGRRRICGGAEVITSLEATEKLKEIANKKHEKQMSIKKKKKAEKEVESENDCSEDEPNEKVNEENEEENASVRNSREGKYSFSSSSEEYDIQDEIDEIGKESRFMDSINRDISSIKVGDWILAKAKFCPKKVNKFYVGQITETESCLEAKFARIIRCTSCFHWPDVEDKSIISAEEIVLHLPDPSIDKRGKFRFDISFESYNMI